MARRPRLGSHTGSRPLQPECGLALMEPPSPYGTIGAMDTILIVDDHAPFRVMARMLLEADGFTVVGEADSGESGIEAARTLKPHLVLLDIGLPDVEGFDVARLLAAEGPPPFVVLTSSRDASSYGPRLDGSRALGFIPKDELSGATIRALAAKA
jgi:DNA-binding NarL/FixJ family response regulator